MAAATATLANVTLAGRSGWNEVVGATPFDVQAGDYVFIGDPNGGIGAEYLVEEVADLGAPLNRLFHGVIANGKHRGIGALASIVVFRHDGVTP